MMTCAMLGLHGGKSSFSATLLFLKYHLLRSQGIEILYISKPVSNYGINRHMEYIHDVGFHTLLRLSPNASINGWRSTGILGWVQKKCQKRKKYTLEKEGEEKHAEKMSGRVLGKTAKPGSRVKNIRNLHRIDDKDKWTFHSFSKRSKQQKKCPVS